MFKKIKETIKRHLRNRKGNEMIALALVLIFIILAVAPYLKTLGETTGEGIESLNTEMSKVLSGNISGGN